MRGVSFASRLDAEQRRGIMAIEAARRVRDERPPLWGDGQPGYLTEMRRLCSGLAEPEPFLLGWWLWLAVAVVLIVLGAVWP